MIKNSEGYGRKVAKTMPHIWHLIRKITAYLVDWQFVFDILVLSHNFGLYFAKSYRIGKQ
jgi:hypothetical protein